jgi:hypothetical protein
MTTYSIKAPDGKTYSIEGPEGATQEQVQAEVMRQNPSLGAAPKPKAKPEVAANPTDDAPNLELRLPFMDKGITLPGTSGLSNVAAGAGGRLVELGRGTQQLVNTLTGGAVGDKANIQAAIDEQKKMDAPLKDTAGGMLGGFATDMASTMLPGGLVAKGLTKVGGMLPQLARVAAAAPAPAGLVGSVAGGAAQSAFEPVASDESQAEKTAWASGGGAVGNLLGRGIGRVYAPFRKPGSASAQQNAALLNQAGLPRQILATQTDDPMIQAATNALEQIPIAGRGVTKARQANADWFTKQMTTPTGTPVEELTRTARERMVKALNDEGNSFRTQKLVGVRDPAFTATNAADKIDEYVQATAKPGKLKPLNAAEDTLSEQAAPAPPDPTRGMFGSPARPPMFSPLRTLDEVMDLRNAAGKMTRGEADPVLRAQYARLRDSYGDILSKEHGVAYDDWLKKWGAMEDVKTGAEKGLNQGRLRPDAMASALDSTFAPQGARDRLINAASENMPEPPKGWNRAMITAAMMGAAPLGAGAAGDVMRGDVGAGTAVGGLGSASLIRALTRGKPPSQSTINMIRELMTNAGIAAAPD